MATSTMSSPTSLSLAHAWEDPRAQQVLQSPFEQRRGIDPDLTDFTNQVCKISDFVHREACPGLLMGMLSADTPNRSHSHFKRGRVSVHQIIGIHLERCHGHSLTFLTRETLSGAIVGLVPI